MLEVEKLSQENIIIQLQKLLSTDHFLRLLGDLTGLTLKTFHRLEIQKWTAGSYTVCLNTIIQEKHNSKYDVYQKLFHTSKILLI